ncbi:adenylate/guanylate cyclase domain-containing protein, partial [Paracoccaceae bacterium]|nr:adenylate/guanylate cyclase domain-containing protein [Paracoccaceae bacterium]
MKKELDRKIAVILVADAVGYSKHMEKDENATLNSYKECETILIELVKTYKGSVFNTAGDSVLVEFPSAVNAVECGVFFQNEIRKRNLTNKTSIKLEFRIGINMGDVIKDEDNLMGDGINIAARLEALAQPSGISISKSVYDFVKPKTKMEFNDLGIQKVKQNEFHAFDILLDPSQIRKLDNFQKTKYKYYGIISAVFLLFISIFFFYSNFLKFSDDWESATPADTRAKIAIYPFSYNKSAEGAKEKSTDLYRHLITNFDVFDEFKVLNSFPNLDNPISNKTASDADYFIKGNLQETKNNLRVSIQIVDNKSELAIFSKYIDFSIGEDQLNIQDNISVLIISELQENILKGFPFVKSDSLETLKLYSKAASIFRTSVNIGDFKMGLDLLSSLVDKNPSNFWLRLRQNEAIFHGILFGTSYPNIVSMREQIKEAINLSEPESDLNYSFSVLDILYERLYYSRYNTYDENDSLSGNACFKNEINFPSSSINSSNTKKFSSMSMLYSAITF